MRTLTVIMLGICVFALFLTGCEKGKPEITTSSPAALELYQEAVELAEKFHDAEAIKKFNEAIALDSTFAMAYYHLSRTYESAGNLATARENLNKAEECISEVTTLLEWRYINAWDRVLENDYTGAISKYQEILKEHPNDRHALFVLGKTYRLTKNYPESVNVLKKLINKYPQYAPGYNQLGYTYYEMGNYDQATATFAQYADLELEEPNPFDSLGDMYRAQGNYHEAIRHYKKALDIKPNFHASFRNLGLSYFGAGEYDSATATYNKFLDNVSDREWKRDVNSDLVEVYLATGQYNKALDQIEKVIELSRTNFRRSWAIAKKGYIYYLKNNFPTALNQLNRSLTIFPDAIWSREWRGLVFLKQHNYDQVLTEAEKMKALIDRYGLKGYQCSYNNLLGRAAMEQGLYDEAIMYFKDSIELDPASCRYPLATAYFKKGEYQKAIDLCQEFFKYNENNALAHLLLAQVYEKQNNNDLAVTEYRKFLDIWKDADEGLPELVLAEN
ncbi:MAG: tetratricopeptide repeat protein, partial [bacterium]